MRRRDQNILSREPGQQLIPRCRSRSLVDVEHRGDLGMLQLDALCMDHIAPKEDFLSLRRKFIAAISRRMTRQRNDLDAMDDGLEATKRVPFTGLHEPPCDGFSILEQ